MIRALPKPRPIIPRHKPERLLKGQTPVTLIAGLRCADGAVLLCADRERSDQSLKRSIDKIFRIVTNQGTFLIAGSGRSSIVDNALMRLDVELKKAAANPKVVLFDTHKDVIETVLYEVHEEYIWGHRDENNRGMQFIITAAFKSPHSTPFLYGTDEEIVFPQQLYGCAGCGQDLAYYFIDKLYNDHLSREVAILIAAFVFREVSYSVSGVGLGTDIQLLAAKDQGWYRMPPQDAQRLGEIIPPIANALAESWSGKIEIPDWLIKFCT
jgi:20S proteasome alpha/beta subunit